MNDMLLKAYIAVDLWIRERVEAFKSEERGAVDIIAIVVLIVIAVAIAFIFKNRIKDLVEDLFSQVDPSGLAEHEPLK